jgi:hypothetical protein
MGNNSVENARDLAHVQEIIMPSAAEHLEQGVSCAVKEMKMESIAVGGIVGQAWSYLQFLEVIDCTVYERFVITIYSYLPSLTELTFGK